MTSFKQIYDFQTIMNSFSQIKDSSLAEDIKELLKYGENTAGGLMAKELVKVNENLSISKCLDEIRKQAKNKKLYIELSGGINENNLQDYCIQGVNGISIGALTHNIKSKDISLDLEEIK